MSDLSIGGCGLIRRNGWSPGLIHLCGLSHSSRQISLYVIMDCLGFWSVGQPLHCRHGNGYVGAWGLEDLFIPHPVESIVEVTRLDPYASCLLVCLSFGLPAIKPVNIACFACSPFLFCFANCRRFVIANNMDQIPSSWWERQEL